MTVHCAFNDFNKVSKYLVEVIVSLKKVIKRIVWVRSRQPFKRSEPFFDSVKIETSPRATRLPYFPLKISVQTKKKGLHVGRCPIYQEKPQ